MRMLLVQVSQELRKGTGNVDELAVRQQWPEVMPDPSAVSRVQIHGHVHANEEPSTDFLAWLADLTLRLCAHVGLGVESISTGCWWQGTTMMPPRAYYGLVC